MSAVRTYDAAAFEATPTQLERLVLLALLGAVESLRTGALNEGDSQVLLMQPTAADSLRRQGIPDETYELLREAVGLGDVRRIAPEQYEPFLDELGTRVLARLASLPALDHQAPRWFCAEADRRERARFEAESRTQEHRTEEDPTTETTAAALGDGAEPQKTVRIEYRLRNDDVVGEKVGVYEDLDEPPSWGGRADVRDLLEEDPAAVRFLRLETPLYRHTARFGARGGQMQHTDYGAGNETLVVETRLDPGVSHCVKLVHDPELGWSVDEVIRSHEPSDEITDLW